MYQDEIRFSARVAESPGTRLGIDEALIKTVVHGFYAKIRQDELLQGMFNRVIGDRWDTHLAKMCDFWSSVMLSTGRFKGTPMVAHTRIHELRSSHFDHWQQIFAQTVTEVCTPEQAELFIAKARLIGQSLQMGVAVSRGELPASSLK